LPEFGTSRWDTTALQSWRQRRGLLLAIGAAAGWALVIFAVLGLALLFTPAHEWEVSDQLSLLGSGVGVAGFGAAFIALTFAVIQVLPVFSDPKFTIAISTLDGELHGFIPHIIAKADTHVPHAEGVFARLVGRIQVTLALESGSVVGRWQIRIAAVGA
jgi:hypothetical protein